ncbi:MAG: AAA family ATPase [bacterium]|nr:AAA family ATPase [bacterium]
MSLEPGGPPIKTTPSPFITRVRLREYKSIASCDVALGAFSVLVGPNGSGKSNFLDALALISDALNGSLERALQARGGPQAVHRQPRHSEEPIRMAIEFHPTTESSGQFEVVLETEPGGGFHVLQEVCSLKPNGSSPAAPDYRYRVEGGRVIEWPANDPPVASADSLYLVRVSGVPEFRPAYDALSRIRICGFDPSRIPPVTPPRASDHLAADAGNLPPVIRRLQAESPEIREDIEIYLRSVLPSLRTVEAVAIGNFETLEFVLQTDTGVHRFPCRIFQTALFARLRFSSRCCSRPPTTVEPGP